MKSNNNSSENKAGLSALGLIFGIAIGGLVCGFIIIILVWMLVGDHTDKNVIDILWPFFLSALPVVLIPFFIGLARRICDQHAEVNSKNTILSEDSNKNSVKQSYSLKRFFLAFIYATALTLLYLAFLILLFWIPSTFLRESMAESIHRLASDGSLMHNLMGSMTLFICMVFFVAAIPYAVATFLRMWDRLEERGI